MKFFYILILICCLFVQVQGQYIEEERASMYGAQIQSNGSVTFTVYSPLATQVELLLFSYANDLTPSQIIPMSKSGNDWTVNVPGIGHGTYYMYRASGNQNVSTTKPYGTLFNKNHYLNDPYAYQNQNVKYTNIFQSFPYVQATSSVYAGGGKSIVYDHTKDRHPGNVKIARKDLIIYEMHVQDYTARIQNLDPSKRGKYLGLAQSGLKTPGGLSAGIDHLVELGVNAVELMPIMEYDELTGNEDGRYNHWGYMTTNFFSPEARYASSEENNVVEFKTLVKALHDKGIAVFMDVVYNHTGEQSPWTSNGKLAAKYYNTMGLHNTNFYRATSDGKYYFNNTGTGNDVAFLGADSLYTKQWVRDSLSLWHQKYGIDGFRFDLARILADGSDSAADWVDNDTRFTNAHLHAEPWDMGGQWWDFMDSGKWNYSNNRWTKWLGKYRDNIRRFSASNLKDIAMFKQLVEGYGSTDSGAHASSKPWRSVNMLTCHDGYTLRDTVYFNDYDGSHNCWDSGGDENLRRERQKLMMGILMTSQGVPLILQGDEFGRTKSGALSQSDAHNTYNYESSTGDHSINYVNWIDWALKDGRNSNSPNGPKYGNELFHWTKNLIQLRKKWNHFRRDDFPTYISNTPNGSANDYKYTYIWEAGGGANPIQIAVIWWGKAGEPDIMVIYNEHWNDMTISNINQYSQGNWKILARSWYGKGNDFGSLSNWSNNETANSSFFVKGRSMAILISDNN